MSPKLVRKLYFVYRFKLACAFFFPLVPLGNFCAHFFAPNKRGNTKMMLWTSIRNVRNVYLISRHDIFASFPIDETSFFISIFIVGLRTMTTKAQTIASILKFAKQNRCDWRQQRWMIREMKWKSESNRKRRKSISIRVSAGNMTAISFLFFGGCHFQCLFSHFAKAENFTRSIKYLSESSQLEIITCV